MITLQSANLVHDYLIVYLLLQSLYGAQFIFLLLYGNVIVFLKLPVLAS